MVNAQTVWALCQDKVPTTFGYLIKVTFFNTPKFGVLDFVLFPDWAG